MSMVLLSNPTLLRKLFCVGTASQRQYVKKQIYDFESDGDLHHAGQSKARLTDWGRNLAGDSCMFQSGTNLARPGLALTRPIWFRGGRLIGQCFCWLAC